MKTRLTFVVVMLVVAGTVLFTPPTRAQVRFRVVVPYAGPGYYNPYYMRPLAPYYYGVYGPFRVGGRPEAPSGISFDFGGIPGALLQEIVHSNVYITSKKLNGCEGAAGAFSSARGGGRIDVPPGTYNVEIRLPHQSITIQNVLVKKGKIVTLAVPINDLMRPAPKVFSAQPPSPRSPVRPIPNTRPMAQ